MLVSDAAGATPDLATRSWAGYVTSASAPGSGEPVRLREQNLAGGFRRRRRLACWVWPLQVEGCGCRPPDRRSGAGAGRRDAKPQMEHRRAGAVEVATQSIQRDRRRATAPTRVGMSRVSACSGTSVPVTAEVHLNILGTVPNKPPIELERVEMNPAVNEEPTENKTCRTTNGRMTIPL